MAVIETLPTISFKFHGRGLSLMTQLVFNYVIFDFNLKFRANHKGSRQQWIIPNWKLDGVSSNNSCWVNTELTRQPNEPAAGK